MEGIKKRRLFPALVLIFLAVAAGGCLWAYYHPQNENPEGEEPELVVNMQAATGKVVMLALKSTYQGEGTVAGDERGYLDTYTGSTDMEFQTARGAYVKAGDVLLSKDQETIICAGSGYVVDTYKSRESCQVTVLNEDRLYVTIQVPYEQFCLMDYDSEVSVKVDEQVYAGYIHQLGYIYQDGYVDVSVGFEGYIMPGRTVEVNISMSETEEKLWINADFVSNVGGVMVTYVVDDYERNITHMQEIQVGERYLRFDNGNKFYFYEVLGGLTENQQIATAPLLIEAQEAEAYNDDKYDFE